MDNLTQAKAAWLISVNTRTLRDYGDAPRNEDGKTYNARDLVAWWVKRQLPTGGGSLSGENKEEAELRLKIAQADEREVIVAQKRGELISADLLTQFLPKQAGLLRAGGERIERHHGRDALETFNEVIDSVCDSTEAFVNDLCEQGNEVVSGSVQPGSPGLPGTGEEEASEGAT